LLSSILQTENYNLADGEDLLYPDKTPERLKT